MDFVWDKCRTEAARLVSLGGRTNAEIGKLAGCSARQIQRFKASPEFMAEVDRHVKIWRKRATEHGCAIREQRIARLNRRLGLMDQVIRERAAHHEFAEAPGGTSGLMIHKIKRIGFGDNSETIDEYAVDTHLLAEMRHHEQQIAEEMGEHVDRHEVTGPGGGPVSLLVSQLAELFTPDELKAAEQKMLAKAAG